MKSLEDFVKRNQKLLLIIGIAALVVIVLVNIIRTLTSADTQNTLETFTDKLVSWGITTIIITVIVLAFGSLFGGRRGGGTRHFFRVLIIVGIVAALLQVSNYSVALSGIVSSLFQIIIIIVVLIIIIRIVLK